MNRKDSIALQSLMASETNTYLEHFTAFSEPGTLLQQSLSAKRDGFFSLLVNNELAGFYCLRGIDEGYEKPSFGIYVASQHQSKGLAQAALCAAEQWCRERAISSFILKVADQNKRACLLYKRSGLVSVGRCHKSGQFIMEKRIN